MSNLNVITIVVLHFRNKNKVLQITIEAFYI